MPISAIGPTRAAVDVRKGLKRQLKGEEMKPESHQKLGQFGSVEGRKARQCLNQGCVPSTGRYRHRHARQSAGRCRLLEHAQGTGTCGAGLASFVALQSTLKHTTLQPRGGGTYQNHIASHWPHTICLRTRKTLLQQVNKSALRPLTKRRAAGEGLHHKPPWRSLRPPVAVLPTLAPPF